MKLRGGVVGFGRMGLTHFSILNQHPNVQFVGVCDSSSFMLRNVRNYVGVDTYTSDKELIDSANLDFLIVATPTAYHSETVRMAVERGIHVFVEKPFSLSVEQGEELADLAARKGVVNQVGYVVRFNEIFAKVRELVANGTLGELLSFKMEMYGPTVLKASKGSWRSKKQEGGGVLYDFASHAIDLVNFVIGCPERVSGSVLQSIYSTHVEDAVYSTFLHAGGVNGRLLANWSDPSYRKPKYNMEVLGRNGKIVADLHMLKLFLRESPEGSEYPAGWNARYLPDYAESVRFYVRGNEFTRQLDYFIDCILKGEPAMTCTFADGALTDKVISMITADAGEVVSHG